MNNAKKALKKEIVYTLMFFVETDLLIYGFITKSTFESFQIQNVEFPKNLLSQVEKF